MFNCFMLRTYKIKNLERKERKEREKELYTVLYCARSWHNSLVIRKTISYNFLPGRPGSHGHLKFARVSWALIFLDFLS